MISVLDIEIMFIFSMYDVCFLDCNCQTQGTIALVCGKTDGECLCNKNIVGENCDRCADGFFGFPECTKGNFNSLV